MPRIADQNLSVRLASLADLTFVGQDGHISDETLRRKIEAGEVVLAERDSEPVAYLRLEYLWSDTPYMLRFEFLKHTVDRASAELCWTTSRMPFGSLGTPLSTAHRRQTSQSLRLGISTCGFSGVWHHSWHQRGWNRRSVLQEELVTYHALRAARFHNPSACADTWMRLN